MLPAHAGMVPIGATIATPWASAPPRRRGWSAVDGWERIFDWVLPAHAGMVPGCVRRGWRGACAPRARGDGPTDWAVTIATRACSPRTRGWSLEGHRISDGGPVLPAHAGMVPATRTPRWVERSAPRARGDGPVMTPSAYDKRTCSPRTRGWSPGAVLRRPAGPVLPAHAGMVPPRSRRSPGPCCAPRARADGPRSNRWSRTASVCSPRTRGWSQSLLDASQQSVVLPAHAGMVPFRRSSPTRAWCAPRARGDGPGCR